MLFLICKNQHLATTPSAPKGPLQSFIHCIMVMENPMCPLMNIYKDWRYGLLEKYQNGGYNYNTYVSKQWGTGIHGIYDGIMSVGIKEDVV